MQQQPAPQRERDSGNASTMQHNRQKSCSFPSMSHARCKQNCKLPLQAHFAYACSTVICIVRKIIAKPVKVGTKVNSDENWEPAEWKWQMTWCKIITPWSKTSRWFKYGELSKDLLTCTHSPPSPFPLKNPTKRWGAKFKSIQGHHCQALRVEGSSSYGDASKHQM